jgi:hypothetical protein
MESLGNYWLFWGFYLGAGSLFYVVFWKLTRFPRAIWTSFNLRAIAAALIFTPWYSNPEDGFMAPALMVATLDAITLGSDAAVRSFVPLALALISALIVAAMLLFLRQKRAKKSRNKSFKNKDISKRNSVKL